MQLPIEIRALDAEGVCRAADVAGEFFQPRQNVPFLELVARFLQRQVRGDLPRRGAASTERALDVPCCRLVPESLLPSTSPGHLRPADPAVSFRQFLIPVVLPIRAVNLTQGEK